MGALLYLSFLCMCVCYVVSIAPGGGGPEPEHAPFTPHYTGQCILCPAGTPGPPGQPGPQGTPGRDGRDGRDGLGGGCCNGDGDSNGGDDGGDGGDYGGDGGDGGSTGGAVYVRWGRYECASSSVLIYSGIAAGGHYQHAGSGSNYLCMPEEPIYDEPQAGTGGNRAILYGAEYEMNTFLPYASLHDANVPCAVCRARNRSSHLMIPARNVCPSSWTKEYAGYLVASYYDHAGRSEFVCMDRDAEGVPRSNHNANGALFYATDIRCGASGSGLACPPYVEGNEITCAVCTR